MRKYEFLPFKRHTFFHPCLLKELAEFDLALASCKYGEQAGGSFHKFLCSYADSCPLYLDIMIVTIVIMVEWVPVYLAREEGRAVGLNSADNILQYCTILQYSSMFTMFTMYTTPRILFNPTHRICETFHNQECVVWHCSSPFTGRSWMLGFLIVADYHAHTVPPCTDIYISVEMQLLDGCCQYLPAFSQKMGD